MATMLKVEFRQSYYDGENFYDKGSVHEFPANTPLPTRDIKILEGKSTYRKPEPKVTPGSTKTKKDVATALRNVQADNS